MNNLDIIFSKIFDLEALKRQVSVWKYQNKKIVFTNGCFDILHRGHIEYLSKAKDLGDVLIIAVNSDSSPYFKKKGPGRPINNEQSRSIIISSLLFVDAVILFNEENPLNIISEIIPDILTKGKDWNPKDIAGYDVVTMNGGEVITIDLTEGYSTTNIIKQL